MSLFWKDKRVLVTGGAGFIGSFVTEILVANGARVSITATSGNLSNLDGIKEKLEILQGDLQDQNFAKTATADQDAVVHLASLKRNINYHREHPAELLRVNTAIALNILESCRLNDVKQVLLVSTNVIDKSVLADEHSAHYGYAWSKYFSEVLAKAYQVEYGLNISIARPANVYGPRDNFNLDAQVVPALIARVCAGEDPLIVRGTGNETRPFAYVEDVAQELVGALETGADQQINIVGAQSTTVRSLVEHIVKLASKPTTRIQFTEKSMATGVSGSIAETAPDPIDDTRVITLQRSLEDGLRRTIQWYKAKLKGGEQV